MRESSLQAGAYTLPVYSLNTAVVGTGAAGYNAADRLFSYGQEDIAIITEHVNAGTSRNTGSDKQTYYKLTLAGGEPDSVHEMARTLFEGGCVDGDLALCEAALSAQCFLKLVDLGVPFPRNRYGEFIGYKTDHDPRRRATSVGPYTSRQMTESLQAAVEKKGIRVFDRMQVVKVLGDGKQALGLICLDLSRADDARHRFALFNCKNIIFATGGPAGMYAQSVYPHGHYGANGLAFEAGVIGKNLTEWQFGLASLKPRWNVSGTYMQSLPRVYSTDAKGQDEREFLNDFYQDRGALLSNLFLKGYQWPFDVRKAAGGSSVIDILVYRESRAGRRIFLDYRENPGKQPIDYEGLSGEAHNYLKSAGACFGTPIDRLRHMNRPAVDFYLDKGVDLALEPLEIALCAQHNNGGLGIDCWWQTNLEGFYAAGEAAASHGVYRPGGSALNAGQVGSTRAAQHIAARRQGEAREEKEFRRLVQGQTERFLAMADAILGGGDTAREDWNRAARRMSAAGGAIRDPEGLDRALAQTRQELSHFTETVRAGKPGSLSVALRLREMLICQEMYLSAMSDYIKAGGQSRGSALYSDPGGLKPGPGLPDIFAFTLDDGSRKGLVQEIRYSPEGPQVSWREVRPIPEDDDFFENVWRAYREHKNIT